MTKAASAAAAEERSLTPPAQAPTSSPSAAGRSASAGRRARSPRRSPSGSGRRRSDATSSSSRRGPASRSCRKAGRFQLAEHDVDVADPWRADGDLWRVSVALDRARSGAPEASPCRTPGRPALATSVSRALGRGVGPDPWSDALKRQGVGVKRKPVAQLHHLGRLDPPHAVSKAAPMMKTPSPAWARVMPHAPRGSRNSRRAIWPSARAPPARPRSNSSAIAPKMSQ